MKMTALGPTFWHSLWTNASHLHDLSKDYLTHVLYMYLYGGGNSQFYAFLQNQIFFSSDQGFFVPKNEIQSSQKENNTSNLFFHDRNNKSSSEV